MGKVGYDRSGKTGKGKFYLLVIVLIIVFYFIFMNPKSNSTESNTALETCKTVDGISTCLGAY